MKLEIILVGIDFSDQSDNARQHALRIAQRQRGALILAHADPRYRGSEAERDEVAAMSDLLAAEALRCRREQKPQAPGSDEHDSAPGEITVSHVCIADHPDPGLAKVANEYDVDLVAVGTHGRTGLGRFFLGSVAERTVRLAETNVLVVRGDGPDSRGYRRILVPTDFSDSAERALDMALSLAAPGGHVHLMHCWQGPAMPIGVLAGGGQAGTAVAPDAASVAIAQQAELGAEIAESALSQARQLIASHPTDHVSMSFAPVQARAKDGILAELESHDYDLCVMGSHGRRGWRRFLLGSTAELTVRHAPCSVLVTRP